MGDMEAFAHELMNERYLLAMEALRHFVRSGATEEEIKTLCRETGVDIKDVIVEKKDAA